MVGSGGLSRAKVTATVFEDVQEMEGKVKDELPMWSLISLWMKTQVGAERTVCWVLKMSVIPGSEPGC